MNLKTLAVVVSLVLSVGSLVFYAGVLYGDMRSAEEVLDRHEKALGTVDARIEAAVAKVRGPVQTIRDIVGECCKGVTPNPIPQPMWPPGALPEPPDLDPATVLRQREKLIQDRLRGPETRPAGGAP